jgi:hypothetical protein
VDALASTYPYNHLCLAQSHAPLSADVQPLDLREPGRPVVAIQYSDEAQQRLAYLYALASAGEVSERTYHLTTQVERYTCVFVQPFLSSAVKGVLARCDRTEHHWYCGCRKLEIECNI